MTGECLPQFSDLKRLGRKSVILYVNGKRYEFENVDPRQTLLQRLREMGLTGTKLGCGEGGCGACTVVISSGSNENLTHVSANACLTPLCAVDSCHVTTVEGLASVQHPIQKRLAEYHGSQCGFCTPGIVMAIYGIFKASCTPSTRAELEHAFDGNLCRCTGYRPILDAAKSLLEDAGEPPCKAAGTTSCCRDIEDLGNITRSCSKQKIAHCNSSNNSTNTTSTAFSEEIQSSLTSSRDDTLTIEGINATWYRPSTLQDLFLLKKHFGDSAKIICGNTEVGIETKFKLKHYPAFISPSRVSALRKITETPEGTAIGGAVTLSELSLYISKLPKDSARYQSLFAISDMLKWFASSQIRNVASLAGNIATASPISDMNPMLMAVNASLTLQSWNNSPRIVPIKSFFKSYRTVDMLPEELITNIIVPFNHNGELEFVLPLKQARRREDDISIVTSGMRVVLSGSDKLVVTEASLAFGGMAPTTVLATKTADALIGKPWNRETICSVIPLLKIDMPLPVNVPGGMRQYRQSLCASFLYKFYVSSAAKNLTVVDEKDLSAQLNFVTDTRPESTGYQQYPSNQVGNLQRTMPVPHAPLKQNKRAPVGEPLMHKSAMPQVTGEAKYTDDLDPRNTLHAALVCSTIPHGFVKSVDASVALKMPGVAGFFTASDIIGGNDIGAVIRDEECFVTDKVTAVGQPLGVIVAESLWQAQEAMNAVKVVYEELPSICTIDEAIASNSFFSEKGHSIITGEDVDNIFLSSDDDIVTVEGEMYVGGQEHFYLETNSTLCIPLEERSMNVISSTQNATKTQNFVAHVLGIPAHKVSCVVKRMGGGFGGKETRSVFVSCAAAIAADALQRPVKITLDRDVDMAITGARHPFKGIYKVGVSKSTGLIRALDMQLYCNAGYSLDLSESVMDRALFHCENAYYIPSVKVTGKCCKTNTSSNTAFRGFGGPQGMMICEAYMEHVSRVCNIPVHELRRRNIYKAADTTPFGQVLPPHFDLDNLWDRAIRDFEFKARLEAVKEFNSRNRWRKRGISIIPVKFGISFTAKFMNQGGALVHVYTDGSVLVSHGGTEMGQGLHTKVIQVVARAFNIPCTDVHIEDTSTNKVPNSSPSAASMSTDLYGMAALNACEQILERLQPVIESMPTASFKSLVSAAYFQRINLSAQGFYIVPTDRCGYDWDMELATGESNLARGQAFNYFTTGIGCTEVEVDVLTGDSEMLRADILMDIGASINPALDIGQIEGAFIQGFGLFTMEELVWGDSAHPWVKKGQLFTKGPGVYKIPSANDVPRDFRVLLAENKANPFAVHSSKAIGEPPLFLASSAFFAIHQAIDAAREESNANTESYVALNSPLTTERTRIACMDEFVKPFVDDPSSFQTVGSF